MSARDWHFGTDVGPRCYGCDASENGTGLWRYRVDAPNEQMECACVYCDDTDRIPFRTAPTTVKAARELHESWVARRNGGEFGHILAATAGDGAK